MTHQLFVFLVGGQVEGCHVELHDMRFAIGQSAEDCLDALRAGWWGTPKSLHIDAFGPLTHADGYAVSVHAQPQADGPRLYFVNLGGYAEGQFTELHENVFVVARDPAEAKKKALAQVRHWISPHRDALATVETVIDVAGGLDGGDALHLHLEPVDDPQPFEFEARYWPIGKRG